MIDVSSLGLSTALGLLSLVIALSSVLLSYVRYKSSTMGDAFTREQIMRERFDRIPHEWDLRNDGELVLSEPRVRTWGFRRWLKSLLPRGEFPGYTHFNIRFRYPNYPNPMRLADEETRKFALMNHVDPPSTEELESNEKLQQLGVFKVSMLREPRMDGSGEFKIIPTTDYSVFVDSADPDTVGTVLESMSDVVEEIQTGEEVFELHETPKSKADFEKLKDEPCE